MLSNIPSWVVAVIGAFIVIVATATSVTLIHQTGEEIAKAKAEIMTLQDQRDLLWSSHFLADQRSTAADFFLAEALGESPNTSFLLDRTAYQLQGAVLAMLVSSGEEVPGQTPEKIQKFIAALRKGDKSAYTGLQSEIDRLRLLSQSYINQLSADIRSIESRIESLDARESSLYLVYVFFNVLGLIVTMCKDLPVWKGQQ